MNLPTAKYCKYCCETKDVSNFRVRVDKRRNPPLNYLNNKCKFCEQIKQREYYHKNKSNPKWYKKHKESVKEHQKKSGYNKRRWQKLKNDFDWKKKIKNWREENRERVKTLQKKRGVRWYKKHKENITDNYVITKLLAQFPEIKKDYILQNPELIDLKRSEIINFRLKKHIQNAKKQINAA